LARLESVAVGGFFPTLDHIVPLIAEKLDTEDLYECRIGDPCAGEGAAVIQLATLMGVRPDFYLCELEGERHKALTEALKEAGHHNHKVAFGDAFQLKISRGLGLLYLNPPYDQDPVHGRLEQRFLHRFTSSLAINGTLIFYVPYYALKASAATLATEYDDLSCYRLPAKDFEVFKQVVLFARKTDRRLAPDPEILAQVEAWAADPKSMPVLGTKSRKHKVSSGSYISSDSWVIQEIDLMGLLRKVKPWRQTTRTGTTAAVPQVLPEVPVVDLMFRTFPVATAPRPAHIAAGIASGLFNGRRVTATTPGMPDLLVKGVFDREYVTIEEKENKEGEVTSFVQVQQPKLVTTVLDLSTKKYSTLALSGKSTAIEELSIEGLLEHYGPSLLKVMNEQCPVLYDAQRDADRVELAQVARKLFTAQSHASKAIVKLLGGVKARRRDRRNKAAILLGEIGSGKTTVALTAGGTIGRSMLVMCPPHLLKSWTDETRKVFPDAEIRILQDVSDVDDLAQAPKDKFLVAILSRETSKLGHSWDSVTGSCPKCGSELPEGDLAKKRQRCPAEALIFNDPFAQLAQKLAIKIAPSAPGNGRVRDILQGRTFRKYLESLKKKDSRRSWKGFDSAWVLKTLDHAIERIGEESANRLFGQLLLADYNPERIASLVDRLAADKGHYYRTDIARTLTLLLKPGSPLQEELRSRENLQSYYYRWSEDKSVEHTQSDKGLDTNIGTIRWENGKLTLDGCVPGSLKLAQEILASLTAIGDFQRQKACGEPLFQAIPEPRRYALSRYIANKHPDLFDLLVLDEGHEYATDGSAQERAAHRLTALGLPTLLMTGSIMNGYAASLFSNMWALSPNFREEFDRNERSRFVDRYGYHKRLVSAKEAANDNVKEFGAVTDRVEHSARIIGDAPGVLPLFLFRHLLSISVTLHKADLAVELPACRQIKALIQPEEELLKSYVELQNELVKQIRKDKFDPEYAGKLFGALAELPSYLDRSTIDTGNQEDGSYEIRYPKSLGSELVAKGATFSRDTISTKEAWMLETIKTELAEGRNVMIFSWHVSLLPRLARLIKQATGEEVPVLYADKVPTGKRQDWIDTHVVNKGRRVMVANPVCIQTGLNNLVHFATEVWMENPAVNPTIFRQAIGRVDRIGQKIETRIYFPVYDGTLQVALYDLLMRKVAVATATDGLDNESMLLAAGAADNSYLMGLSIGKQLWAMLQAA
jgi:hypothetical protein